MKTMSRLLRPVPVLAAALFMLGAALPAQAACIIHIDGAAFDASGKPRIHRCPPIRVAPPAVAAPMRAPDTVAEDVDDIRPRSRPVRRRSGPTARARRVARALGQGYAGFARVYSGQRYTGFRKVYRGQRYTGFRKVYAGPRYPSDLYGGGYGGY